MEAFLIAMGGLILLDLAAWRWGARSIESVNDTEWVRRREWRGFQHHS